MLKQSRPVLTGNGPHGTLQSYDIEEHDLYISDGLSDAALGLQQGADWYVVFDTQCASSFSRKPFLLQDASTHVQTYGEAMFEDLGDAFSWASRMASLLGVEARMSVGTGSYQALCVVHRDEWLASQVPDDQVVSCF